MSLPTPHHIDMGQTSSTLTDNSAPEPSSTADTGEKNDIPEPHHIDMGQVSSTRIDNYAEPSFTADTGEENDIPGQEASNYIMLSQRVCFLSSLSIQLSNVFKARHNPE